MDHRLIFCMAVGGACAGLVPANAAEPVRTPSAAQAQRSSSDERVIHTQSADILDQVSGLPATELDVLRAGQTIVVGNQSLSAITTDNTLNGNYTAGAVTLSGNALANFSGIGNFAINTGAQVSLLSGMNLTINIGQ